MTTLGRTRIPGRGAKALSMPARPLAEVLEPRARRLVEAVAQVAAERALAAYVVGGAVRDWLVGRLPVREVDVAVVGDAESVAGEAARRLGGRVVAFPRFGTARLVAHGTYVDVARARTERYPAPGALPVPEAAPSIDDDLLRRDFTINAMAVPLWGDDRALVDPWGGLEDLRAGRLRALHPASFQDDPTRLFRGVRLAVRYGLRIEPQTAEWMRQALACRAADTVSAERRGQEVRRALQEEPALPVARAFDAWGLWDAACPGWRLTAPAERVLDTIDGHRQQVEELLVALGTDDGQVWALRLLALADPWLGRAPARIREQGEALAARLALTRELRESLCRMGELRAVSRRLAAARRPSTAHRLLEGRRPVELVYVAVRGGPDSPDYNWVGWLARTGRRMRPRLTGRDLMALGCPAGPALGRLQRALTAAVLDGKVRGAAQEKEWVVRRLQAWRRRGGPGGEPSVER